MSLSGGSLFGILFTGGCLCPGRSLSRRGLCPEGVFVRGGPCPGWSLSRGFSVQGVSVWGSLSRSFCPGGSLSERPPSPYGNMRAVRILLECILWVITLLCLLLLFSAVLLLTISVNPRCGNFLSFYGTQMIHADYSVAMNLSIFNKTLYIFLLATVTNSRAYKQCEVTCK